MTRRVLAVAAVGLLGLVFAQVLMGVEPLAAPRELARAYLRLSPEDLHAPNVVSGILLAYRGFDTLGEIAVLFMVAASLGPLLKPVEGAPAPAAPRPAEAGEIVESGRFLLMPLIFVFGAYVILHGHLSAGGGFQGGAIVASGVMLHLLAEPRRPFDAAPLSLAESAAGVLFVLVALAGMVLAGGAFDPRFLPMGELGALYSAGALPLASALLGVKVAAELSVVLIRFRD